MSNCNVCGKFFEKAKSMTNHRRWCDKENFINFQNNIKKQMRVYYYINEGKLNFKGKRHKKETIEKFKRSFTKERKSYLRNKAKNNEKFSFKNQKHTLQAKKKVSDANKGKKVAEKNPMWKGDDVGYGSLHEWIRNHKPKPLFCECCKITPPFDLANISQEYKRDINDFEWLCRKCHMIKDDRLLKLIISNRLRRL